MATSAPQLDDLAIRLQQNQQPVPASIAAPLQLPDQAKPDLSIGATPHPQVIAPRGTIQGDQAERSRMLNTGAGEDQIQGKLEGSQFGQVHPVAAKILGGLGQGLAKLGDVGLSAIAPALAINLPGTEYHHLAELHGLNKQIGSEEGEQEKEAQTADLQAQAPLRAAQTKEEETKAQDQPAVDQAEIAEHNAQASALLHPQAKTDFEAWQQQNPGKPIEEWLKAQSDSKVPPEQHVPVLGDDGKPTFANYSRGEWTDSHGQPIKNPRPIPPPNAAGAVTMIVPGPDGQQRVERLSPGQVVAPGAQTAAGVNAVNTPTTQQRTAAGRAETVVAMAPEVMSRIDALAPKLGPIEGRWNEYMQGKIGMNDPDFAALRSDLLMMSSAVALAHAQGRLPENLREEFDRAINAPTQTPANLKATIQTMLPWLQQMQNQGQPNRQPANSSQEPSRPANVPDGYKFNANGPKGAGWYAPTAK
jgi:hypothetical protein